MDADRSSDSTWSTCRYLSEKHKISINISNIFPLYSQYNSIYQVHYTILSNAKLDFGHLGTALHHVPAATQLRNRCPGSAGSNVRHCSHHTALEGVKFLLQSTSDET